MEFNEITLIGSIFETLPIMTIRDIEFKPLFEYGSHEDLLLFLKQVNHLKNKPHYPLIWLETPLAVEDSSRGIYNTTNLNLVIATLSDQDKLNKERMETTFKEVLYPLLSNIKIALSRNGVTNFSDFTKTLHFNYSPTEKEASEIWDAIQVQVKVRFKKNCEIKNIYYE